LTASKWRLEACATTSRHDATAARSSARTDLLRPVLAAALGSA
jgi:hypothetical protein